MCWIGTRLSGKIHLWWLDGWKSNLDSSAKGSLGKNKYHKSIPDPQWYPLYSENSFDMITDPPCPDMILSSRSLLYQRRWFLILCHAPGSLILPSRSRSHLLLNVIVSIAYLKWSQIFHYDLSYLFFFMPMSSSPIILPDFFLTLTSYKNILTLMFVYIRKYLITFEHYAANFVLICKKYSCFSISSPTFLSIISSTLNYS